MDEQELFHEANFDILPNQSSIYGVSCISGESGSQLLVALNKGRIFVCEYGLKPNQSADIKRVNREVTFTYIPGNCHIISIDSFSCAARGLIIGVTFCKESTWNFFNVYCNYGDDVPSGQEWHLDNVAQNCRSFDLSFTPYQLTHCKVKCPMSGDQRTVFVLLGGEKCFNVYAQGKSEVEFAKEPVEKYFVELERETGIPTYLEMQNVDNQRITAIGYESGEINLFVVQRDTNEVKSSWVIEHDSPIAQCQLFSSSSTHHLVVVSARELSMLYRDVLKKGFSNPVVLSGSASYDCSTCCAVADINYDGKMNILIGTYGQKILAYPCNETCETYGVVEPIWSRDFAYPVFKIKFVDMTGDGVNEMVVISTKGVHILQSNLDWLLQKCRANLITNSSPKELKDIA